MIIDTHLHPTNLVDEAWRHTGTPFNGERMLKMMDGPYMINGKPRRIDMGFIQPPPGNTGYRDGNRRGREGIRVATQLHPDLVSVATHMPDLDGWSVLHALKGSPDLQDVRVVLTAVFANKNRAWSVAANDYLTKPIDRQRLARVMAGAHLRRVGWVPVANGSAEDLVGRALEDAGKTLVLDGDAVFASANEAGITIVGRPRPA